MSFLLPELIVESVIRDGIAGLCNNLEVVDNIFASLTEPYNAQKYGEAELNKIKNLLSKKQIAVVHNLHDIAARVPCYSIQLGSDSEKQNEAMINDFSDETIETLTDPADIAALVKASSLVPTAYNSNSGKLSFTAGTDLTNIQKNNIYVDASGAEFSIQTVVKSSTEPHVFLVKGLTVDISDFGEIRSSLNFKKYEKKTIVSEEQLIIGCHSKDALTTKYLYILLKYFLNSRKESLIKRCFIVSTFQGSDFSKAAQYQGDHVYHRFYTIRGRIDDSWRADEVDLIENLEVEVLVPKGEATAVDLEKTESSIKPSDREDFEC